MKKIAAVFAALFLLLSPAQTAAAVSSRAAAQPATSLEKAQVLRSLGLFRGVSDTDFALQRSPTRTEAVVMLVRLLGREEDALAGSWKHPFTDVPAWADAYIGYAYENGLTRGVSETEFGTGDASRAMFLTFVLRALGYTDRSDVAGGEPDFRWDDPYALALKTGIDGGADEGEFKRSDVADISYAALSAKLKDSGRTLSAKLFDEGAIRKDLFLDAPVSIPVEEIAPPVYGMPVEPKPPLVTE